MSDMKHYMSETACLSDHFNVKQTAAIMASVVSLIENKMQYLKFRIETLEKEVSELQERIKKTDSAG